MLSTPPALIAVVGPVEPPLLAAWVRHYQWLGIERFLIAFHFPEHVPDQRRHELQAASRELGVIPTSTSSGPWHEHTNTQIRDALRQAAGPGWHLLADADEFQQYPVLLTEVIAQAEKSGRRVVGGLMLDRVAASGHLTGWRPEGGLDLAHPLGGHLTHRLLHGDPRKIVLARGLRQPPGPRPPARCGPHLRRAPLQVAHGRLGRPSPPGPALLDRHLARADPGRQRRGQPPPVPRRPAQRRHQHQRSTVRLPQGEPGPDAVHLARRGPRHLHDLANLRTHRPGSETMTTLAQARRGRDDHVPLAVLLAGITGSGKTTVARPWPITATSGCPWTRRCIASTADTAWTTQSTPTSSANAPSSRRPESASSRRSRRGTMSSSTTGCGAVASATLGGRPPPRGLPPRHQGGTAATPRRAQPARRCQCPHRDPGSPRRLLRPLRPTGRRRRGNRLHRRSEPTRDEAVLGQVKLKKQARDRHRRLRRSAGCSLIAAGAACDVGAVGVV